MHVDFSGISITLGKTTSNIYWIENLNEESCEFIEGIKIWVTFLVQILLIPSMKVILEGVW